MLLFLPFLERSDGATEGPNLGRIVVATGRPTVDGFVVIELPGVA